MILYNVTYGIDKEIESEWLLWMKSSYIPGILDTGLFSGYRIYKVLSHEDEVSSSYCVQYFVETIEQFNRYLENFASAFIEELKQRYKDRHVAFNTLLEEV